MGIQGLAKLLSEEAPDCIREVSLSSLQGRKIAIDASLAIYQFLIAIRSGGPDSAAAALTNAEGETTSHIQGLFNRTIRFLSLGIKPVYVFDGKPPNIKSGELMKRREKRDKAAAELEVAKETGNIEEQDKQLKRLVRAGHKENEDCIKLLGLMGVPVIRAPCEAEAQCAHLAREGIVYGVGTEDMDVLTFKTPMMLRKMNFSSSGKSNLQSINYKKAIQSLDITEDQFIDLCILLGCDYCDKIKGLGPKTALKLIRQHSTIETILEHLDPKKYIIPSNWTDEKIYDQARHVFMEHEVLTSPQVKWTKCKSEELQTFLVDDCGFNPDRVKGSIDKLENAYKAILKPQTRMDSFFKILPSTPSKRKAPVSKSLKKKKK